MRWLLVRRAVQPVGELESLLVGLTDAAVWMLRCLGRVEAGIFAWERYQERAELLAQQETRTYDSHLRIRSTGICCSASTLRKQAARRMREIRRKISRAAYSQYSLFGCILS